MQVGAESTGNPQQFHYSPELLERYIQNIVTNSVAVYSSGFETAIRNFQSFLEAVVKYENEFTLDFLWTELQAHSRENPNLRIIFAYTLIDVEIGDRVSKANKIATNIEELDLSIHPSLFLLVEYILSYLEHVLHGGIQFILQGPIATLVKTITKWTEGQDEAVLLGSFHALFMVMTKFGKYVDIRKSTQESMLCNGLVSPNLEIREISKQLLSYLVEHNSDVVNSIGNNINGRISSFEAADAATITSLVRAAMTVLDVAPSQSSSFVFQKVPLLSALTGKDVEAKKKALVLIPFCVRVSPNLFDSDTTSSFFKKLLGELKKKMPMRQEAMLCLGNFIFWSGIDMKSSLKHIAKCKKAIMDVVDSDEAIYASAAVLMAEKADFSKEVKMICSRTRAFTPKVVELITDIVKSDPGLLPKVRKRFLVMANSVLLDSTSSSSQICLALSGLQALKFTSEEMPLALVMQYRQLLYSDDIVIKKATAEFILRYHNSEPSVELAHAMLSFASTEMNNAVKLELLSKIVLEPKDPLFVHPLANLLRDSIKRVRRVAFKHLLRLMEIPDARLAISEYVNDMFVSVRCTGKMRSINLFCFLELAKIAVGRSPGKQHAYGILLPYITTLSQRLLRKSIKMTSSMFELLSFLLLLAQDHIDVDVLYEKLYDSLQLNSPRKMNAVLKLLVVSIRYTSLRDTIYTKHAKIIGCILKLSKIDQKHLSHKLLFRVLSTIGAVNPSSVVNLLKDNSSNTLETINTVHEFLNRAESSDCEEVIQFAAAGVAIASVFQVLRSDTSTALQAVAYDAMTRILKKRVQFGRILEEQIATNVLLLLRSQSEIVQAQVLQNMKYFVTVLGDGFAPLVPEVVKIIHEKWDTSNRTTLVSNSEWMARMIPTVSAPHLPKLATLYVSSLDDSDPVLVTAIFSALSAFKETIMEVDHIVFPALMKWMISHYSMTSILKEAMDAVYKIITEYGCNRVAHYVIRTMIQLVQINRNLDMSALNIIYAVAIHMGPSFLLQLPQLTKHFDIRRHQKLENCIHCYRNKFELPIPEKKDKSVPEKPRRRSFRWTPLEIEQKIVLPNLKFDESQWISWSEDFFNTMIKYSDSALISCCDVLVERHRSTKQMLASMAVVLCRQQERNMDKIDAILNLVFTERVPAVIIRQFVGVLEIMELMEIVLPVPLEALFNKAVEAEMNSFALRIAEVMFRYKINSASVECLVSANQRLGLNFAAGAALDAAKRENIVISQNLFSEGLGGWNEALGMYEERLLQSPNDKDLIYGRMKCLTALMKFGELKDSESVEHQACAYWHLLDMQEFMAAASKLREDSEESMYYIAIAKAINDDSDAQRLIDSLRRVYCQRIFPLVYTDYEQAYDKLTTGVLLNSLEEYIHYKDVKRIALSSDLREREILLQRLQSIKNMWVTRFCHLQDTASVLLDNLCFMNLIFEKSEMKEHWLRFITVGLAEGKYDVVKLITQRLEKDEMIDRNESTIVESQLEWLKGNKQNAINLAQSICQELNTSQRSLVQHMVGKWQNEAEQFDLAYESLKMSVEGDPTSRNAWYSFANVSLTMFANTKEEKFLEDSFKALLNGLCLPSHQTLIFTLKTLSILFRRGNSSLYAIFREKLKSIRVDVWNDTIPQIIARANTDDAELRDILESILLLYGKMHPVSLAFALMVPMNGNDQKRKAFAESIIAKLSLDFPEFVQQMISMSNELVRISSTWWESTLARIDQASVELARNNNPAGVAPVMLPFHAMISQRPETVLEVAYSREFGRSMQSAGEYVSKYEETGDIGYMSMAWELYTQIYKQITQLISEKSKAPIKLAEASSWLAEVRDTQIPIPMSSNSNVVYITRIKDEVEIISSRNKPRRITMIGSDGNSYHFLLKAHDDLRNDQRIMEIFSLINSLVAQSSIPLKQYMTMRLYNVSPITPDVGLIGWVPNCSTLYGVVERYRQLNSLDVECESKAAMVPDKFNQPHQVKLAAFRRALGTSAAFELQQFLLRESRDSENWLNRRKIYSTSLSVSSMATYVTGLGDRHARNIIIEKSTAQLVHIDFGEVFDSSHKRSFYPETVPFRLGRMFLNALEVTGIEGTFKKCSENLMNLMRDNKEQITGLLEIFIYDPLDASYPGENIIEQVSNKLEGRVLPSQKLETAQQIDFLIHEATDPNNLCQMFDGWSPWW